MGNPPIAREAASALRTRLLAADDAKIARILAVVETAADPNINRVLLDPLRARLAALKPGRKLRFTRLLFIPLDPLIVPAPEWKPGEPAVPRTALDVIAGCVRRALGGEAAVLDAKIEGLKTDASEFVSATGATLWPRAAEILAGAGVPDDWGGTGLRHDAWAGLARSVATVLRRAPQLRALIRDSEIGAIEADDQIVRDILRDTANEPPEGCAMLARLILEQSSQAAALLRRLASLSSHPAEKAVLRQAVATGMDRVLTRMEESDGLDAEVGQASLPDATGEVRRIAVLLTEIEDDPDFAKQRQRVHGIRAKLDRACRARFASGMEEGLISPLTATTDPVDGAGQTKLENRARDLRSLEKAGRKIGGGGSYDRQLVQAAELVLKAAETGMLTPVRRLRLIEILSGVEAAEAMYDLDHAAG